MKYKIEKGIPIPNTGMVRRANTKGENIELLRLMEPIRDSVFFDDASFTEVQNRFYSSAKRNGMKLIIRKVNGGVRMWRES